MRGSQPFDYFQFHCRKERYEECIYVDIHIELLQRQLNFLLRQDSSNTFKLMGNTMYQYKNLSNQLNRSRQTK